MDLRVFVLICLAAASRHQPSSVFLVEANDPQDRSYNEADFQRLRDGVNSGNSDWMHDWAHVKMWPSFVKAHPEEGWHLFEKLAKDKRELVKEGAACSPAWPALIQSSLSQSVQLFAELMDALEVQTWSLPALPLWEAFREVPPTAVAEQDSQELLGIARSLQTVADLRLSLEIKGLPLFDGFSTPLRRSTNETWLGEMVKLPLFASNAAPRASPAENV